MLECNFSYYQKEWSNDITSKLSGLGYKRDVTAQTIDELKIKLQTPTRNRDETGVWVKLWSLRF
jgi:hypothetical protein